MSELSRRLEEDADYIQNYVGFVGNPFSIARTQREAAATITKLEAERDAAEQKIEDLQVEVHELCTSLSERASVASSDRAEKAEAKNARLLARIEELRTALERVRVKAIPAGGAIVRRNPDWRERASEVLNIIDNALYPNGVTPPDEVRALADSGSAGREEKP